MKRIASTLILVIFGLTVYSQESPDRRTQFFPVEVRKPEHLPRKSDLWVFILAGQSNMAGRGHVEPMDTIPSERILTINEKGEIIIAKEPLHFYEPGMRGLDCGLSFGKTMVSLLPDRISVLIIPAAVGGSRISQWLGDSVHRKVQLFTNFREKVEIGKKYGKIKGVLWHQGEGDANPEGIPLYSQRLKELFGRFRETAGNRNLVILMGELGSYSDYHENWMKINEQIRLYSASDKNSAVISTSGLKDNGDKVHFDSEGQRIMGQRFADEYIRMVKRKRPGNKLR